MKLQIPSSCSSLVLLFLFYANYQRNECYCINPNSTLSESHSTISQDVKVDIDKVGLIRLVVKSIPEMADASGHGKAHLFRLLLFSLNYCLVKGSTLTYTLNDGNEIPAVAFGTSLGHTTDGTRVLPVNYTLARAVRWALEAGYNHIDTAAVYQVEDEVGLGIQDYLRSNKVDRDAVYITSKLWNDAHEEKEVIPALKKSLKALKIKYVDLYLMHYPMAFKPLEHYISSFTEVFQDGCAFRKGPSSKKNGEFSSTDYLETWKGIENAKKQNLARSIGVSNFNVTQMKRLWENSRIKPAVLQLEVNPTITQKEEIDWCHKHGVVVMAYSPFGGVLGRTPDAPPPRADHPLLLTLAEKYNKTVAQILLRYLLDRHLVPIPRSTNKNRIRENIDIMDFSLTTDEVEALSGFNKNYRVRSREMWYSHPHYPYERTKLIESEMKTL